MISQYVTYITIDTLIQESGNMNNDELIKFIEDIIVEYTQDRPAALFLDSLGYQHNSLTLEVCNKHNITVYRIPPNTTAWLQPCDVVLFGPAKEKVRKQHKVDRQLDIQPTLQRTSYQGYYCCTPVYV